MNQHPEHLVYRWLRLMKIPVSKMFLKQQLLSRPDYPSLVSITNTLDELNIEEKKGSDRNKKSAEFLFKGIKFFVQSLPEPIIRVGYSEVTGVQLLPMNR